MCKIIRNGLMVFAIVLAIGIAVLAHDSYYANSIAIWRLVSYASGTTDCGSDIPIGSVRLSVDTRTKRALRYLWL